MLHFFPIAAFAMYLLASVVFLASLPSGSQRAARAGSWVHKAGLALHTIALVPFILDRRLFLLSSGGDYIFWLAWLLSLSFAVLGRKLDFPIIGALVCPAVALFLLSSSYLVHLKGGSYQGSNGAVLIGTHVIPAMIAELCLMLAFVISIVFLLQSKRLKRREAGRARRLPFEGPSLTTLERFQRGFLLFGFISISLAVVSGCIWSYSEGRALLVNDLRQWLGVCTWILLALLLHSRITLRWSAKQVAVATVLIVGLVLFSFLMLTILTGSVLHGGYYVS
jgi:ABC-type uncharacterized transport system permease subunit